MGKILKFGCGFATLVVIITFSCVCFTLREYGDELKEIADSSRTETESKGTSGETSPKVDYDLLITLAQDAVSQVLHDPGSADFEWIDESNILIYSVDDSRIKEYKDLGPVYMVWGQLRAKNAFGATVMSYYAVDIQFTKEGKYVIRDIEVE